MKRRTVLKCLSCCLAGILLVETPMQVGAASYSTDIVSEQNEETVTEEEDPKDVLDESDLIGELSEGESDVNTPADPEEDSDSDQGQTELGDSEDESKTTTATKDVPDQIPAATSVSDDEGNSGPDTNLELNLESVTESDPDVNSSQEVLTAYLSLAAPQYGSLPKYSEDFDLETQNVFIDALADGLTDEDEMDISSYAVSPSVLTDALSWLANEKEEFYTLLPYVEYTYVKEDESETVQSVRVSRLDDEALLTLNLTRDSEGIKLSYVPEDGIEQYRLFRVDIDELTELEIDAESGSALDGIPSGDEMSYEYILCGYRTVEEELRLCAFSKIVVSEYQASTLLSSDVLPVAPELSYVLSGKTITLNWKAVDGVDGYILYQYIDGAETEILRLTADGSAEYSYLTEKEAEFGATYRYLVSSYIIDSNGESIKESKSAVLPVTVKFNKLQVSVSEVTYNEIELVWDAFIYADGYELQRKDGADEEYRTIATITGGDVYNYTDSTVEIGAEYTYQLRPYRISSDGITSYGEWSDEVTAAPELSAGEITAITAKDYQTLNLEWKKISGADGYTIYRSVSSDESSYSQIKTIASGDTLSYSDSGLEPGITYYYKIRPYRNTDAGEKYYGEYSSAAKKATALGKVSGVKAASSAYNAITLSWSKVTGATGYVIERSTTSSASDYAVLKTITSGDTLTYKNSSLTTGTKYYYRIRAYYTRTDGTKAYGSYSSAVSATPKLTASKISSVTSVNYNTVKITWSKVTGATGYKIYRSTSSNGTYSLVKTITSQSTVTFQNTGLTMNTAYYYKVRPYRTVDGKDYYGDYSSAVKGTPKLGQVTGAKAASASYQSVKVSWSKVAGASGYVVYYSTSKDSGYKTLKTTTGTSYTHTGLTSGKTYYYKVRAYRTVNGSKVYGAYSSVVSGKPVPATVTAKRSTVTYNSVKITWSKISGANGYEIYRSGSKTGTYTKIKTITSGSTLTYTNSSLTTNKTYYYKVRAYRTVSGKKVYGSFSAVISGTPKMKTTTVKKSSLTYNSVKLSWTKIDGASGYQIYRSTSKNGTYKSVKTITSGSTLTYTNSGLTTGTTYYYKVRPYRTINGTKVYGDFSEIISVKPVLSKVTDFKATPTGNSSIKLTWSKVTGATGYVISRSTSKTGTYTKLKTITSGTTVSYTNSVSTYGQTYYYKIYAVRNDYNGTEVGPVSAMASVMNLSDANIVLTKGDTTKLAAATVPAATVSWSSSNTKVVKVNSSGQVTAIGTGTATIYAKANGLTKSVKVTVRGYYKGIDVSSYQGSINWSKVADSGIEFAMIRAITGTSSSTTKDTKFESNYSGAKNNGISVGVYRYSYATSRTKARKEAQNIIDALDGRKLDYPIVMDVEDSTILAETESNARRSEIILAFKEVVEDAGYDFALYANVTWLNNYLDMNMLKDVDIWVARWRSLDSGHGYTGKGNVTMWQYTSSGSVSGISGNVDLDVSYKKY